MFCDIASGAAPAHMVYADDDACAFLDIDPVCVGHTLVVPRRHVPDLATPGASAAVREVSVAMERVSNRLLTRLDADGVSVFQSNGAAAGQEVFHLHFHLLPRWSGDRRLTIWQRDRTLRGRLEDTHRALSQ